MTQEIAAIERQLRHAGDDVAKLLSSRAALRAVPALSVLLGRSREFKEARATSLVLVVFRALYYSWLTTVRPGLLDEAVINEAADNADRGARPIVSERRLVIFVPAYAAYAASGNNPPYTAAISIADAPVANGAAALATAFPAGRRQTADRVERRTAQADSVEFDAVTHGLNPGVLARQPIWTNKQLAWTRNAWGWLKDALLSKGEGWEPWIEWYERRLVGGDDSGFGLTLTSEASRELDIRIAAQPNSFWERDPSNVNADLKAWIDEARRSGDREGPLTPPSEPASGPGPQYQLREGKLSQVVSPPWSGEAKRQSDLHLRLKVDAKGLAGALERVANRYPELANAAGQYAVLFDVETDELDVVALWSVGGSLSVFARSYREQNTARTLAEPLEPQFDALLQNVVRQHGAFVMGFREGRDLVHRADEFAVDAKRLAEIEAPGNALLNELTDNRHIVDDETRALHTPVRDSVTEFGWAGSRSGYSAYLIVRNGVRAMIKLSIGDHPNVSAVLSLLAAGSTALGDPNMEFVRAVIPALQHHSSQLLTFFNHSPEMRAYVEWALQMLHLDSEHRE